MTRLSRLIIALILSVSGVQAEQKKVFDGPDNSEYELHYIALNSTFLDPEIAQRYDLVRSKARGFINVSLLQKFPDGRTKAVMAVVQGKRTNEIQQQQSLNFQQIVEGEAVYYLAQLAFAEGDPIRIDLEVYPSGASQPLLHRFSHTFFND